MPKQALGVIYYSLWKPTLSASQKTRLPERKTMILITYDLNKTGQNYSKLHNAIKSLGAAWWHRLDSTWLVKTRLSTDQVTTQLKPHIDDNDWLLVMEVKPSTAHGWLAQEDWNWIKP
jgi:hypothetical protein